MSATPQYGIGVAKNRFELFDDADEEDPLEILKRREIEREERRKAKLAEKENKSKQVPPAKSKAQKVLKETQKTKAPAEIQKPKEDKKIKLKKDADGERGYNANENREYSSEQNWYEDEANHENTVGNDRDRRDLRDSYSGDGFQRGGRGRRGLPRGVFVRGGGRGGPRGGGGGGERDRGERGGGYSRSSFDSRGKREFDRQSGSDKTGVKPVDKRDGAGAHNWGSTQDDWNNQQDDWNNQQQDDWNNQQDDWNSTSQDFGGVDKSPNKTEEGGEQLQDPPVESTETPQEDEQGTQNEGVGGLEDKPEMTLDEWKALKTPKNQPSYNIRKPGEGEDLSRWKKMYALNKKKEEEGESDDEYEYEICEYPQRVGRQRRILDIDIKFKDARGGSGERGRGRGFGRGQRGAGRGSFNREPIQERERDRDHRDRDRDLPPAPKVDDEKDFPSLA